MLLERLFDPPPGARHPRAVPPGHPGRDMRAELVRILDGNAFVLSEPNGDVEATFANPCGFFGYDTRFLSCWRLTLDGERLPGAARRLDRLDGGADG